MKKLIFLCAILSVICTVAGIGQTMGESTTMGRFGVGLMVGEPTGFAWKYRFSEENALDGSIGFLADNGYRVSLDYLWHVHPFRDRQFGMDYGAGFIVGPGRTDPSNHREIFRGEEIGFGLRGVAGLNYTMPTVPLDFFVQGGPVLIVSPDSKMSLDAGFGMRVYF